MEELRLILDPHAPVIQRTFTQRAVRSWRRTFDRLAPLGGSSDGNLITLFHDGDAAFGSMLDAIAGASGRVWLETYIFEPDALGLRVIDALTDAARRGADVMLLVDAYGSQGLSEGHIKKLRDAGGRALQFNPPFKRFRRSPLWERDHRKILLVDDDIGFCGGMNVSVDYAGPALGNGRFRDTHARFEGPCVQDLARVFAASVHSATGERLALPVRQEPYASGVFAQVLQSDVRRRRRHIQRALHQTVSRSGHHCFLTSPYFVPPPKLTSALVRAKRRGVDVKVLTAGLSDVPLVRLASQHLYGKLLRAGVGIYEMFGRTLHAKTATIDGIYASVGSFNLDRWSYLRNLEVNVAILDARLALELEERFASDLAMSQEVHLPTWEKRTPYERVLAWIAYQFLRL